MFHSKYISKFNKKSTKFKMGETFQLRKLPVDVDCTDRNQRGKKVAYQNLICQFQKLDPLSKKWNSYKDLIRKIAQENSPLLREQALEVVLMFVQRCGTANESAYDVLSSLLNKKQVSVEGRAEKIMIKIILHYAGIGSLECVIEQLVKAISYVHEAGNKVPATCLRIITRILSEFGADALDVQCIIDTLRNVRSAGDQEFRSAVKALILELLVWLGKEYINNMELILNPQELESVLKQYDSMSAVSCGRQNVNFKNTLLVKHELHLLEELDRSFFTNLISPAWAKRRVALQELEELLDSGTKLRTGNYDKLLVPLKKIISNDQSPIVVELAINCVKGIAIGLQQDFSPYAVEFCRLLLEKFGESRERINKKLRETLEVIVDKTSFESIIKTIDRFLGHQNPDIRLEAIQLVNKIFKKSNRQTMIKKEFKVIFKSLANCLYHRQQNIMEKSLEAFSVALNIAGKDIVMPYLENIDPITKRKIKNYKQEHDDSFGEKFNEIKYRNFRKESPRNVEERITECKDRCMCNKKSVSNVNNYKVAHKKKESKNTDRRLKISSSTSSESLSYFLKSELDEHLNANDVSTMVENQVVGSKSLEQPVDDKRGKCAAMQGVMDYNKTACKMFKSNENKVNIPFHRNDKFVNELKKEVDLFVETSKATQLEQNSDVSTNLKSISIEQGNIEIVNNCTSEAFAISNEAIDTTQQPPGISDCSTAKTELQPSSSLVIPKHPEGYIMFTEDEFKKLLGLKKCHGNYALSDDSSNLVQDKPSRNHSIKPPCEINVRPDNALVKETQTTCDLNDEDTKPGMWQEKITYEIPTQTLNIVLKETGTNPICTKRYNRGTQWVKPPIAMTEVQTQTHNTANSTEIATGVEIGKWNIMTCSAEELANSPSNQKKPEPADTNQITSYNMKSIFTKKVEINEQSQKMHQKRLDINTPENGNTDKVQYSNKFFDINPFSTSKSNSPFRKKSGNENNKLKIQTTVKAEKKTKCEIVPSKREKIREKDKSSKHIQIIRNHSNHKIADSCERKSESPLINALSNSVPINDKRRKPTADTLNTSQNIHPSATDKLVTKEFESKSVENTSRNETTIRIIKTKPGNTKSRFRSKSALNIYRNEEPFIKGFNVDRSNVTLLKSSHSVHKPRRFRNSSTKKYPKFRHRYLSDSSTGSLKEGCNWLTFVKKIAKSERTDSKNTQEKQYLSKRHRSGQHYIGSVSATNRPKRVLSQLNEQSTCRRQKRNSTARNKYNNRKTGRNRDPNVDMSTGDRTLDPKAKQLLLSEILRLCDISQSTFDQLARQKASRPCLFTPKAILQRVNIMANAAKPSTPDIKGI